MNERRQRKTELRESQQRISRLLSERLKALSERIDGAEMETYSKALHNIRYGLANQELIHLSEAFPLPYMR